MKDIEIVEYIYKLTKKIESLQLDVQELKSFKNEFIKKKSYKAYDFNFDLNVSELSKHFNKSYENMRLLKKKYLLSKDINEQWVLYCKSYYFDREFGNKKGVKQ